jgi:hypothetical protein
MRAIDATLKARIELAQQTLYNNAQPQMEVTVTRPRTPITRAGFWQESIVTAGATAICTSVAVRRSVKNPTRAYVAYVTSGGSLVVKYADLNTAFSNLNWITEETIAGCTACALEFDGSFVPSTRGRVEYLTDETPWLFYVTSEGELMAGLLGGTYESLAGANVTAIDAIRGVASIYKDEDQGLMVFFIQAGDVYHRDLIAGIWEEQAAVTLAPADAVSIKAERVFDWRIVLQITDSGGALYEVFSKMQASGWNSHEFIELAGMTASAVVYPINFLNSKSADEQILIAAGLAVADNKYTLSPVFYRAWNIEDDGDWGKYIVLRFDERVWNTKGHEDGFYFEDALGVIWYGQTIENNGSTIIIEFVNFNNATSPVTLYYEPGEVMGDIVALEADSIALELSGLVPYETTPPEIVSIENTIEWEA